MELAENLLQQQAPTLPASPPLSASSEVNRETGDLKSPKGSSSPEFGGFFPQAKVTKENTPPAASPDKSSTLQSASQLGDRHRAPLKSPDSGEPVQARSTQAAYRRRAASEWVEQMIGVSLPASSDHAFRRALKDGTLLCKILNLIRPGCITRVIEPAHVDSDTHNVIQTMENVSNFLTALQGLRFPASSIFSMADIESIGWEDRPRVVECLLTLKRLYEAERGAAALTIDPFRPFAPISPVRTDNLKPFQSLAAPSPLAKPHTPVLSAKMATATDTPEMNYSAISHIFTKQEDGGGQDVSGSTAAGVTRLMQHYTSLLQGRIQDRNEATVRAPDGALDAMGPVLESVLGSLTQEYEKRLLAKEHEVKAAQHEVKAAQTALKQAQGDLYEAHKSLAENANRLPVCDVQPGMTDEERAQLEEMRQREQNLKQELEFQETELKAHRELLREQEEGRTRLMHEFDSLQQQAAEYRAMADKYAITVEENRRLYNQVQDLKGNIRVFCRIRPLGATGDCSEGCTEEGLDGELALYNPQAGKRKLFKYDKVFGMNSNQEEVYEDTKGLIRSVLDGYNVCIFAYGQTGSGKTHTMAGTNVESYEGRGINYRALDDLFALTECRRAEVSYEIRVQLLEIYNEQLRDLLEPSRSNQRLEIRSTERSGLNVPDAWKVPVSCTEDVLEVMKLGAANRAVAETKMNERSSRSHSVLTVMVDGVSKLDGSRFHGCLHLIDLAGSERVGRSEATGDRLEEAKHINRSLSALGDVMAALANKDRHVPFRNSKLTQLLQDSLQGQAKAMMFIHISPEASSFSESISTLAFGSRVSEITLGAAKRNVESAIMLDAREAAGKLKREAAAARAEAAAAREALEDERAKLDRQRDDVQRLEHELTQLKAEVQARQGSDCSSPSSPSSSTTPHAQPMRAASQAHSSLLPSRAKTPMLATPRSSGIPTPKGTGGATPRPRPASNTPTGRPPILNLASLNGVSSPHLDSTPLSQAKSKIPGLSKTPSPLLRQTVSASKAVSSTGRSQTPLPGRDSTPLRGSASKINGLSVKLNASSSFGRSMSTMRGTNTPRSGSMTVRSSTTGSLTARGCATARNNEPSDAMHLRQSSNTLRRTTSGTGQLTARQSTSRAGSTSSTASTTLRSVSTMRQSVDGGFGAMCGTTFSQAKPGARRWA